MRVGCLREFDKIFAIKTKYYNSIKPKILTILLDESACPSRNFLVDNRFLMELNLTISEIIISLFAHPLDRLALFMSNPNIIISWPKVKVLQAHHEQLKGRSPTRLKLHPSTLLI